MNKPIKTRFSDKAYEQIKKDIFDFKILPGERFSENELAIRFGFSRTPVREALFRLAREGCVEVSNKSGWNVRKLDFEQIRELYDVRIVLELAALKTLCEKQASADLSDLESTWLVSFEEQQDDWQKVGKLDELFHSGLIAATGNREMMRIHHEVTERIRIVRRLDFTKPKRVDCTYQEHASILRAIKNTDVELAQKLLRAHIEVSADEVHKITLHMLHMASGNHSYI